MRTSVPTAGPSLGRSGPQRRIHGSEILWPLLMAEYLWRIYRERQQLKGLDPRLLKDLGLSQDRVDREVSRTLLDAPRNRPDARF